MRSLFAFAFSFTKLQYSELNFYLFCLFSVAHRGLFFVQTSSSTYSRKEILSSFRYCTVYHSVFNHCTLLLRPNASAENTLNTNIITVTIIIPNAGMTAPPSIAAYINGVSVHSMDFDDTWNPATHPSGPVLPAVLALAESMTGDYRPTLADLLVAYNVGIQVQGLLLRCSESARAIPDR